MTYNRPKNRVRFYVGYPVVVNFLEKCIINFVSQQQNATLILKLLFIIMKELAEFGVRGPLLSQFFQRDFGQPATGHSCGL